MFIKRWKFFNNQINLHEGINVICESQSGYDFDSIGLMLSQIYNMKYDFANICEFTDLSCLHHLLQNNSCEIINNNDSYLFNCLYYNGNFVKTNMKKQKDFISFLNSIDKPIFCYFKNGARLSLKYFRQIEDYNIFQINESFSESFGRMSFSVDQMFWMNMFVKNKINQSQYTKYHCELLTKIINEIILINNYTDFDYSFYNSCFVIKRNGIPQTISIRDYDIGCQIGMIMHIYRMFLYKHEDGYIGNPNKEYGIIVSNVEFGERPSYSDKKWKYYDVLHKYFNNMQFIMI